MQVKGGAYKSIFRDSNWLLELPFFTVKLLRKLTGILEVPGISREDVKICGQEGLALEVEISSNIDISLIGGPDAPRSFDTCMNAGRMNSDGRLFASIGAGRDN